MWEARCSRASRDPPQASAQPPHRLARSGIFRPAADRRGTERTGARATGKRAGEPGPTPTVKFLRMATHEVSLNISQAIPVDNVDIEIAVRRNGRAFGKVKISKGAIDWMPANKSKTAYYLDWSEFANFMANDGHPL